MEQIEAVRQVDAPAPSRGHAGRAPPQPRPGWQSPLVAAALAALAGAALIVAGRRRPRQRSRRAGRPWPPGVADKTLGWASPAVLAGSPRRRFYDGGDLDRAVTIEDLRAMAHRRLPRFALEYLEGGGEDEASLARNIEAWTEWRFRPRSLVDVAQRDVSTMLFGRHMAMPLVIAPTGLNALFWPHADLRLAQAAAEFGVPYAQSTMSNDAMERVGRVPDLRYWWQLYVFGPREVSDALIDRARDNRCEALIVTIDAQTYGNREWDTRAMGGATSVGWGATFDALRHPRWLAAGVLTHGMPRFDNVLDFLPRDKRRLFDSAQWIRANMDRGLSWQTLARIRDRWPRKLIVKGLLGPDEVVRAAELGADAVALSNHGGRQLDWSLAPLDLLPAARQAVGDRIVLLVDGGIRRGTDVIKAVALGADAVLAGRAMLYGVAAAGRAGVSRALTILREELDRDLALLGVRSIGELGPGLLVRCGAPAARCEPAGEMAGRGEV